MVVWNVMVLLCLIEPQGKFKTMVQNIKLHYNYPTLLPDVDLYKQLGFPGT